VIWSRLLIAPHSKALRAAKDEAAGPEVAQAVQLGIEYDPDPPFDAGSPEKAPDAIVELVTQFSRASTSA
jgi:cyclohexyl-isocyanide hydratase